MLSPAAMLLDIISHFHGMRAPVYGSVGSNFQAYEEKGAGSSDPPLFLCGIILRCN